MALSVETCSAQHIGDRKEQQDRIALFPHTTRRGMLMAVLADGMGGTAAPCRQQVVLKARQNLGTALGDRRLRCFCARS
jgi:serine/threonine protein phosphatase PrpC